MAKKTIEISEETWEKIKDQLKDEEQVEINSYEDFIGHSFFFRTLTYHWIGTVVKKVGILFELSDSSVVFDSGRFMDAIKSGKLNEVEPVGSAFINIESCTDIIPWKHSNPKEQK